MGLPAPKAVAPGCPANLARGLSSTGRADQVLTVEAVSAQATTAQAELWLWTQGCWRRQAGPWPAFIGARGFSAHHREGDGTTPIGRYRLGPTVYGNAPNPGVHTYYHRLVCGDWWDEDPTSPAYNTFQHVPCGSQPPFGGGSEALWTETAAYPSFLVVDYNVAPVVPHAGSAIFVHASTGEPTAGCISLPLSDLDSLLRRLRWAPAAPVIVMGPASEIRRS